MGLRRIYRNVSWGHCVYLLIMAITIVAVPEVNLIRFLLAGLLVALAAIGVFMKLTGDGSRKSKKEDEPPAENKGRQRRSS